MVFERGHEDFDTSMSSHSAGYGSAFHDELMHDEELVLAGQQPPGNDLVLPGSDVPVTPAQPVVQPLIAIPRVTDMEELLTRANQNHEPAPVINAITMRLAVAGLAHAESRTGNTTADIQQRALGLDLAQTTFLATFRRFNQDGRPADGGVAMGALGIANLQAAGLLELTPANVLAAQTGPQAALVNRGLGNIYSARTDLQQEITSLTALATRTAAQQRDLDQYQAILAALPTVTSTGQGNARTYTLTAGGNRANLIQAILRRYST